MVCSLKKVELMIIGTLNIKSLTLPKYNTNIHGKKCFMYESAKL